MITRSGRRLLGGSIALLVAGRVLGLVELAVVAAAGLLALGVAVLRARFLRPDIEVTRTVRPTRVHVGGTSRVEVAVANRGRRPTAVMTLLDRVNGLPGAELHVAPLQPGEQNAAAYHLPAKRRGLVRLGPVEATVADPLGLARRTRPVADVAEVTVLPPIDDISPMGRTAGREVVAGAAARPLPGRGGDDFHALRPYVVGDDLRRVHWPSSARTGELVVRHDEDQQRGRATILLDTRRLVGDLDLFDRMVSAAASIAAAQWRRRDPIRLVTTSGGDTGWVAGEAGFDALLERLAVAEADGPPPMPSIMSLLGRGAGQVVAVVGRISPRDLAQIHAARSALTDLLVVRFTAGREHTAAGRLRIVDVAPTTPFPAAWDEVRNRRAPTVTGAGAGAAR